MGNHREIRAMAAPAAMDGIPFQSRLREHLQKLPSGAHVDRLRGRLSVAIAHKCFGDSVILEMLVHLSPAVEQDGIGDLLLRAESDFSRAISDGQFKQRQPRARLSSS